MNVLCKNGSKCSHQTQYGCKSPYPCVWQVHKPAANESVSSSRTSGSPTAERADSVEATASQLAPVLRPFAECLQGQHHRWDEDFLGEFILTYKCVKCGKVVTCWH